MSRNEPTKTELLKVDIVTKLVLEVARRPDDVKVIDSMPKTGGGWPGVVDGAIFIADLIVGGCIRDTEV